MAYFRSGISNIQKFEGVATSVAGLPSPIASFRTNASGLVLPTLKTTIEAVQSGSGDPSPSNPRPISGWTEANLSRVGKNLFINANPMEGKFLNNSSSDISYTGWNISDFIPIKGGETYHFKPNSTLGSSAKGFFYTDNDYSHAIMDSMFNSGEVTITAPNEARYVRFSYRDSSSDIQLEIGSQATAYEAPNGTTVTLQFGTTIYGGSIDWVSGVVTVKKALFDLGSVNYTFNSTHGFFYTNMPADSADNIIGGRDGMSDIYKLYQGNLAGFKLTDSTFTYNNSSIGGAKTIGIRDTYTTDVDVFKTRVTGHYVIYELATPTTIQLTPQQIEQLRGENNVFVDCGEVEELEYIQIQQIGG